jgi:GxxExxY protein
MNLKPFKPIPTSINRLSHEILDSAYNVHSALGPGLLENIYELFLVQGLQKKGLKVKHQVPFDIELEGFKIDGGLRLDLLVEDQIIVEIKAVESVLPIHHAQLLTYLKLTKRPLGLLINFNVVSLKQGIKRVVL